MKFRTFFATMAMSVSMVGISTVPAMAADAPAAIPAAKQQLIQRLLELWPVEAVGLIMLEGPLEEILRQARSFLQARSTPEDREAALKDINGYIKEFTDQYSPLVLKKGKELTAVTVVPIIAEKMTEDELRQMISILESPVKKKFEGMMPELKKSLGQKLTAEEGPKITPKMEELRTRIANRLKEAVNR